MTEKPADTIDLTEACVDSKDTAPALIAALAQQADVMDTVQRLRKRAHDAGNLKSTEQQKVIVEQEIIRVELEFCHVFLDFGLRNVLLKQPKDLWLRIIGTMPSTAMTGSSSRFLATRKTIVS